MYIRLNAVIPLLLCFIYASFRLAKAFEEEKVENALRVLNRLTDTRKGLFELKRIISDIDTDLRTQHKRTCSVGGGMSYACGAEDLDKILGVADWIKHPSSPGKRSLPDAQQQLKITIQRKRWSPACSIGAVVQGYHCQTDDNRAMLDFLGGQLSPGKRFIRSSENIPVKRTAKLEDLDRKRKGLEVLKKILSEMDADIINEQKRNCNFNLGGHCPTESAAAVADEWHYLNSPLSPGRKRRETKLYKKLISGKLIM